ncbi:DNA/RNA polymerases superfamily protein [Gossypium australe]|uniref:DNA/RNA polymerases superfamily protein n=1 Tax=Gossypium australe TaxID=47621 RepID=A0A5B6WEZ9_9ROSI|nr:DNA/RNA polymerases superfamily protein [Gossypium australe]
MQASGMGTTPLRVVQQLPRGRSQAKGGNGMGRGQRAPGRGASHTEARQPALVYASCRRENGDAPDVITDSGDSSVKDIRMVKDFSDVFPKELPRSPPNHEVEFGIELLPTTAPVSIAPYRVAPKELVEFKAQIQELLDRGFIRPSVSPWGHRFYL